MLHLNWHTPTRAVQTRSKPENSTKLPDVDLIPIGTKTPVDWWQVSSSRTDINESRGEFPSLKPEPPDTKAI